MQTQFSLAQLAETDIAEVEEILRKCVHCGFCTATCPTYVVRGDELDSPRGRIYLMRHYFENEDNITKGFVKHIDRCLSCLSCMTTCPSDVNYGHLVQVARKKISMTHFRPISVRVKRKILVALLPFPKRFRFMLFWAILGRGGAKKIRHIPFFKSLMPFIEMIPKAYVRPSWSSRKMVYPAHTSQTQGKIRRVALHIGCAQQVLDPAINEASINFLTRHGIEVVVASETACCGALTHHMGLEEVGRQAAIKNLQSWQQDVLAGRLDAIVTNASGCGTMLKEYASLLKEDPQWQEIAAKVTQLSCDISEVADELALQIPVTGSPMQDVSVAYHAACSLQHGLKINHPPKHLLQKIGAEVVAVKEAHLCCGSAGTYNLLQPEIANSLRQRKQDALLATGAQIVVAGNIGCLMQISTESQLKVVHLIQLLDWVTGGEKPENLKNIG